MDIGRRRFIGASIAASLSGGLGGSAFGGKEKGVDYSAFLCEPLWPK